MRCNAHQGIFRVLLRVLLMTLFLGILASPTSGSSNFVIVPIGNGVSIEIPKNWVALSENRRITIDTLVEAKGYRLTESTLSFSAHLYDDQDKILALVNIWFYPENTITQSEARQVTAADLEIIDQEMQRTTENSLRSTGLQMSHWAGSRMQVINGLHALVYEHQHSGTEDVGAMSVRSIRIWNSPRSFTMRLSYRERDAVMLLPIIDYMTNSIQQQQ